MSDRGWAWEVHPVNTGSVIVANGQSGSEDKARAYVEDTLDREAGAAWGMVLGPAGQNDVCRRGQETGTFVWKPTFAENCLHDR